MLRTGWDSDGGDSLCCPISHEPYTETDTHQPVFLPDCGHTFSRASIEALVRRSRGIYVTCPLCMRPQQTLRCATDCRPNWDTIHHLQQKRSVRQREHESEDSGQSDPRCVGWPDCAQSAAQPKGCCNTGARSTTVRVHARSTALNGQAID
jgi:hypothetical protein